MTGRSLGGLVVLISASLMLGSEMWPEDHPPVPLVGFSFSPLSSQRANRDPGGDLTQLLEATQPDLVRLPVYWDWVAPTSDRLDFSSPDSLLAVVAAHNSVSLRKTHVVLTIGARNFLYPELHAPPWAGPRQQPYINVVQTQAAYRRYFDSSIFRYRDSALLYAWQIENEPFDVVGNDVTGDDQIEPAQLAWEFGEVRRLDPIHKAVTTTYDGWNAAVDMLQLYSSSALAMLHGYPSGHPEEALKAGDALGLDLYLEGPSIPLDFTSVELRAEWKQQALAFWAGRTRSSGKELWLTEMQAEPWSGSTSFSPSDLVDSAQDYREEPLQVVLMWGVETWLQSPGWMSAGLQAMNTFRSS